MLNSNRMIMSTLVSLLIAGGVLVAFHDEQTDSIPSSDVNLIELNAFDKLAEDYNASKGKVRLVSLLSPTCPYCVAGFRAMRNILERNPDADVKVFLVWEPMLRTDNRDEAVKIAGELSDERVVQYWDEERITAHTWRDVLDISRYGWDVYMLYDETDIWSDMPTTPYYWMHQLSGVKKGEWLDEKKFEQELKTLLQR